MFGEFIPIQELEAPEVATFDQSLKLSNIIRGIKMMGDKDKCIL